MTAEAYQISPARITVAPLRCRLVLVQLQDCPYNFGIEFVPAKPASSFASNTDLLALLRGFISDLSLASCCWPYLRPLMLSVGNGARNAWVRGDDEEAAHL